MKAIILAAGTGSRLKHLTVNKPKCLVELEGKAILEYQLDVMNKSKLDKIIIVGGHFF